MAIQGLTEADKLAIQKASQTAGLTAKDQSAFQSLTTPPITQTGAITPSQMSPTTAYPVTTPVDTGVADTSSVQTSLSNNERILNDLYAPTQKENDISSLMREIGAYGDVGAQETARTAQLQADPAIQAKRQQVQDLSSQAEALMAEAKAIAPTVKQQNLLDYSGRGIASGIVESKGQREIRQRQLDNAIQALSVGSLLSAAQGNLTLALDQVDRAVKAEFEPKKAELAAKRANLEMLMNDPALTREEKRRGAIAEARLKAEEDRVKKEEEDKKTIQGLALQAQQNGAPTPILRALINSKNLEEALVAGAGWTAKETAQSIQEYNFAVKNGYKGSYTQYQNEDANRKAKVASAGVVTPGAPTSYKEWELAGKPGTYADYLASQNIKAPTVAQQTVATYAARLEQSIPTIDSIQDSISKMNPIQFEAQSRLPSYLQTAEYQQFDQAARNFINATLRRESGAVISPSEFDNAYKQYLPRAGDTQSTLTQKKQNRDIVYSSLRKAAGNAYQSVDELLGGQKQNLNPKQVIYQGKTYNVDVNGDMTPA